MPIWRKLYSSITLAGLFLVVFGAPAFAANPHSVVVTVTNSNASTPADGDLTMNAYIQTRPTDVITLDSPSQQYTTGTLLVNLADFSAWAAGEVLVVQVTNTANQEVGTLNVTIANDDPQLLNLQLIAGTGTLIVRGNLQAGGYAITGPANFNGNLSDGTLTGGYYQKTLSTGTPIGNYTVVWSAVAGYFTPANETMGLAKDGSITFTGTYNPIPNYNLTVAVSPAAGGTVNRNPAGTLVVAGQYQYLEGTEIELTPVAAVGYQFKEWQGGLTGDTVPGVLTINANTSVTAVFEEIPYLSINKTEIVFTDTRLTDTLTITNNGQGLLSWVIEVDQGSSPAENRRLPMPPVNDDWLSVSPLNSGSNPLAAGQSAVVTLTVLQNRSYAELTVKNTSDGVSQPDQLVIARINQAPVVPDTSGINFRYLDGNAAPVGENLNLEAVGVDTPILVTGPAFEDDDGTDYQIGREYEIWTHALEPTGVFEPLGRDFDQQVFAGAIQGDHESVSFGRNILKPATFYGLRVRYQDNYSAWSAWSGWFYFTTVPAGETLDDEQQGVPSDQFVDLNMVDFEEYPYLAGHTNDETDARVVLATEAATGAPVPVLVETDTGILVYLRQDSLGSPTAATTAPYGVFTTRVENITAGEVVTLTFTFPDPLPAGMLWYKYDETTASWAPYDETNWDFGPAANQVTVRIKDGDYGDADRVENTVAVDPSGPITLPSGGGFISDYSGGGGCFIATAAFGSCQERHVWTLRLFRDRFLLTNRPGRAFVRFYYRHSPALAGWIAGREWARSVVRSLLMPLYGAAYLLINGLAGLMVLAAGLVGLTVLVVVRRRTAVLAAAAGLLLITAGPLAALDANHLVPAAGESALVRTYTADLLPAGEWQLDGLFNYAATPLEGKVNGVEKELSEAQYILTVSGAYAFNEKWQLGGSFPWLVKQEGELTGVDEAVESAAGDLRLEAKYRFCGGKDQLGYALVPFLTLPTGDDDPARGFFGRSSASAGVIFVADRNWCNHTHIAFNLGLQVQEEEELDRMTIENSLLFGLGLSRLLSNERTTLALEVNGRADDSWFSEAESTPIEILGSLTQQVNDSLRLSFGLGSSLNDGYGAPDYRLLLGLKAVF